MTSERECYVYIVPPGATEFVTAARFQVSSTPHGDPVDGSSTDAAILNVMMRSSLTL